MDNVEWFLPANNIATVFISLFIPLPSWQGFIRKECMTLGLSRLAFSMDAICSTFEAVSLEAVDAWFLSGVSLIGRPTSLPSVKDSDRVDKLRVIFEPLGSALLKLILGVGWWYDDK